MSGAGGRRELVESVLPGSPYRVPPDGSFRVARAPTSPPEDAPGDRACRERLAAMEDDLDDLQRALYAENRRSVLCVFQAIDAAGKDSTIRAVMRGMNPAGFQVSSFKKPSDEELDHDFLWRTARRLPERGRIGVFNRSYYEETLVVRVHPELLEHQRLPHGTTADPERLWQERFESIRDHERHLVRNGTVVLKFWLNVSKDEQLRRFEARLRNRKKYWKFSVSDVEERRHWDAYMHAYEQCLRATSTPYAPWYAIPADSKPWMRLCVARILAGTLQAMAPRYPQVDDAQLAAMREALERARAM